MSALCPVTRHEERLASVGRLCFPCARNIARDCLALLDVYRALLVAPVTGLAERVSGSTERPIPYSDARGDARDLIRRVLQSWAKLVVDERRVQAPPSHPDCLAPWLAAQWQWLASHDLAEEAASELHELAWGQPWKAAYPMRLGRRTAVLAFCPAEGEGGVCGGEAKAHLAFGGEGARRASVIVCEAGHEFEAGRWLPAFAGEAPGGLTIDEASVALYGDASWVGSVRALISRGRLARGSDGLVTFESVLALHAEWNGERTC